MSEWKARITADLSQVEADLKKLKDLKAEVKANGDFSKVQKELDGIFKKKYTVNVDVVSGNGSKISQKAKTSLDKQLNSVEKYLNSKSFKLDSVKFDKLFENYGGNKNPALKGAETDIKKINILKNTLQDLGKIDPSTGMISFSDNIEEAVSAAKLLQDLMSKVGTTLSLVKANGDDFVSGAKIDGLKDNINKLYSTISDSGESATSLRELYAELHRLGGTGISSKAFEGYQNEFNQIKKQVAQAKELANYFNNGTAELKLFGTSNRFELYGGSKNPVLNQIRNQIEEAKNLKAELESLGEKDSTGRWDFSSNFDKANEVAFKYKSLIKDIDLELKRVKANGDDFVSGAKIDGLQRKMEAFSSNIKDGGTTTALRNLKDQLNSLSAGGGVSAKQFANILGQFDEISNKAKTAGLTVKSFGSTLKDTFAAFVGGMTLSRVFDYGQQEFRKMYEDIKNIDSAMVELRKVTDETQNTYSSFLKNSGSQAKSLGTTIPDYISSTADFARLGYNFKEAQSLSKTANIYNVVGDDLNGISDATETIVSTMTAFNISADDSISIVNKLNNVSKRLLKHMETCGVYSL